MQDAPAASRAESESTRASHHRYSRHSGIPRANGFNGFLRALSGDRAFLSPSPARCASIVADLIPASRNQDHAPSPSACQRVRPARRKRPPLPAPNVRDDRETPLLASAGWRQREVCRVRQARQKACDKLARRAILAWRTCAICRPGKSVSSIGHHFRRHGRA